MSRLFFLIAFLFSFLVQPSLLNAQEIITYKTASEKLKKVYRKGLMASRSYDLDGAMKFFEKAIKLEPQFIDAHIQVASILYERAMLKDAEAAFERILEMDETHNPKVLFTAGMTEWRQNKYGEAAEHFDRYLNSDSDNKVLLKRAQELKANCIFLTEALNNPVPFDPKNVSPNINTEDSEYLPTLTADGQWLFYTKVIEGQEDFYMSRKMNGEWQKGEPIDIINTPLNEGAQTLTADGRLFVFTACDRKDGYGSCDLYYSRQRNGRWQAPINIGRPVNTTAWESQPSLSANGEALYFSSKRPGGMGGRDIWVSYRQPDGSWGKPENLGAPVNTARDEEAPYIHPDNSTLYFMSDGHPGMGGKDLYLSRRGEDGRFGEPQNLGYPINTKAHEGALFISLDGRTAYFATDRELAGDSTLDERLARRNTDIYAFDLYEEARPLPATYVKARVYDAETNEPLIASIEFTSLNSGNPVVKANTDLSGTFLFCLPALQDYGLNVRKSGYLFFSENFALSREGTFDEPYVLDIPLQPISKSETVKSKPIILKNVFFETGSAELLPSSITELTRLKELLEENPGLRIRINGHTDNVGSEEDNQLLSENRAKSVYTFLLDNGIEAERLRYKGFGESQPISDNERPEGRQANRRTEFEVIR
jgi:outer membrane protein OmpA-like peptidoglycan-associated protein/tetratricopeptide (TPR) repeat protein